MVGALQNPYQKYLKTKVETASQPQLLVMLFDAAVKKLHGAKKAIHSKNIEDAHNNLVKVQKIFSELMVALDFEMGGDLAKQLFSIYEFVYRRLVDANIKQDTDIIDEVLPIVDQLREGWTAAVKKFEEDPDAAKSQADAARTAAKATAGAQEQPMRGNVTSLPVQRSGGPPRQQPAGADSGTPATPTRQTKPQQPAAQSTAQKPPAGNPGAAYGPGTAAQKVAARATGGYGPQPPRPHQTPPPKKPGDEQKQPPPDRPHLNLQG